MLIHILRISSSVVPLTNAISSTVYPSVYILIIFCLIFGVTRPSFLRLRFTFAFRLDFASEFYILLSRDNGNPYSCAVVLTPHFSIDFASIERILAKKGQASRSVLLTVWITSSGLFPKSLAVASIPMIKAYSAFYCYIL